MVVNFISLLQFRLQFRFFGQKPMYSLQETLISEAHQKKKKNDKFADNLLWYINYC